MTDDPHRDQPVARAGAEPGEAAAAVILLHGRGASARSILSLGRSLGRRDVAYLAPSAAGNQWYPQRFVAPIEQNEPWLTSALAAVAATERAAIDAGIAPERIFLGGFSQGACLAVEYAARNPRRYGGVFAFSGGLIGEEVEQDRYPDGFAGTPVFFGCSDRDPHIPVERVHASADVVRSRGADVDVRIYPGMPHTVNQDEVDAVGAMIHHAIAPVG